MQPVADCHSQSFAPQVLLETQRSAWCGALTRSYTISASNVTSKGGAQEPDHAAADAEHHHRPYCII